MADKTTQTIVADKAPSTKERRAGFDGEGKPFPGVAADGTRKALTYEGAQREFGVERGAALYATVARAGGFGRVEGNPDLSLAGLAGEHKQNVEQLLAEAEKE